MRIRYMELPMQHIGEETTTPFVIIVDRCGQLTQEIIDSKRVCAEQTGAQGVLVFSCEVEIGESA